MELQTKIKCENPGFHIDYTSKVMMLGSCFVENIGEKLNYYRFKTDINPCGIIYNPLAVSNTLNMLLQGRHFIQSDLLQQDGRWVSLDHHGRFSDSDADRCLQKMNERLESSARNLRETDVLVITWGTAWVYRHLESGKIVANCHKFPASAFERSRLEVDEIVRVYTILIRQLLEIRPGMKLLFTVSPVRHWKDGAHGNQLSKSVLLLAIDKLVKFFAPVSYFPSYEIVMDELRDYRFYAEDMLHISAQGVDYIWEKFQDTFVAPPTKEGMKRIDKINKTLLHRPTDPDSPAYLELKERTNRELHEIEKELGISFQV